MTSKRGRPPNNPHELHVNMHIPRVLIPVFIKFKANIVKEFGINVSNGIVVTALVRRALLDWADKRVKVKRRKAVRQQP